MQNTQAVESHLHTGHVNTSESEDLHLPHHKPRDVAVLLLHTGYVNTVNQVCVIITLDILLSCTSTLVMSTQWIGWFSLPHCTFRSVVVLHLHIGHIQISELEDLCMPHYSLSGVVELYFHTGHVKMRVSAQRSVCCASSYLSGLLNWKSLIGHVNMRVSASRSVLCLQLP